MPGVTVIVPWRGGCPWREASWAWTRTRWREHHPEWQLLVGEHTQGPWSKGAAVAAVLGEVTGDVVVVADADVWCKGTGDAVHAVAEGQALWAMPHRLVHRLTPQETTRLLGGAAPDLTQVEQVPYRGVEGGGIVVQTREVLARVPIDWRFVGWGQEDEARGRHALPVLAGSMWRGAADLLHLWHPPAARLDDRRGSVESMRLYQRYLSASQLPDRYRVRVMQAVIDEITRPAVARGT